VIFLAVLAMAASMPPAAMAQSVLSGLSPAATARLVEPEALAERLAAEGRVRVIVEFASPPPPPGQSYDLATRAGVEVLTSAVARAQDRIIGRSLGQAAMRMADEPGGGELGLVRLTVSPMFALNADAALLQALGSDPEVVHIHIDEIETTMLSESVPLIGMPASHIAGAVGSGETVVVIDSGVRRSHQFMLGGIVGEACFNQNAVSSGRLSFCPNGAATAVGTGASCTFRSGQTCNHGTHVAGIVNGLASSPASGNPREGVARGSRVFAINSFSCSAGTATSCSGSITAVVSDTLAALEYVFTTVRFQRRVAAVNLSLGPANSPTNTPCTTSPRRGIIADLRNVGIATVVSAGNDGFNDAVSAGWACIPEAIAVASTTKSDTRSGFSNWGSLVNLAAPGSDIRSSWATTDTAYRNESGTSMAAPHVAGAFAAIRSRLPNATVQQIQNALFLYSVPVTHSGRTQRRIDVAAALRGLGVDTRPPNNLFANRANFGAPGLRLGWNYEATAEAGQPNIAVSNSRNAVWWRYTPATSGMVTVDTCDSHTDFDTTLAVFTGSAVNALTQVAANDDACGRQSRVQFPATAGTQYQIAVAGYNNATGRIGLRVQLAPPAATTTTLSGPSTGTVGQTLSFTATVSSGTGTPSGTVEFRRNGSVVATRTLNASGQAVYETSTIPYGSHEMSAHYRGTPAHAASTSATRSLTVDRLPTTTSLTAPPTGIADEPMTFTATVSSDAGAPAGIVSFRRNGDQFATATTSAGVATVSASLPEGTHQITARFLGSATHADSLSAAQQVVVDPPPPAATTTSLSGPSSGMLGRSLTFSAVVAAVDGTPGGIVRFRRDGSVFASATLDLTTGQAIASVTTSDLPEGTHRISARYIGNSSYASSTSTVIVVTISSAGIAAADIATGLAHSCRVEDDQTVSCWGRNNFGQLGDGTTEDRHRAVRVPGLNQIVQIVAGRTHTCALRDTGRIFCWGENSSGQLGNGATVDSPTPVRVRSLPGVVQISAGAEHSCALRENGNAHCWGRNEFGQLGDGTTINRTTHVRVSGMNRVTQIEAGGGHSCVLRDTGRVFCWGRNISGQLGDATTTNRLTPVRVAALTRVTQIATGGSHSCGLRDTGAVFCWGNNGAGQLGNGGTTNRLRPVRTSNLSRVAQITAGGAHSCGLRDNGRVFCWGNNGSGRLGDGTTDDRPTPVRVSAMDRVLQIATGAQHSCALRDSGRVFCWGNGRFGRLGDGTETTQLTPVRVMPPAN